MHTVDEIDICPARGSENDFCSCGETARGMRGQIIRAQVSFGLDNHPGHLIVFQNAAQQRGRKFGGGPIEKSERNTLRSPEQVVQRMWVFDLQ